jgi:carboxyl-terminal processing protease
MASWFIKDGVLWRDLERDGRTIDVRAQSGFYLPDRYQRAIAILIDRGTGSSPEFLTVALQQRGRAKVFGQRSAGCLGSFQAVTLPDGASVAITSSVSIGPISDARINGVGITPDVEVQGRDPVDVAAEYLRALAG